MPRYVLSVSLSPEVFERLRDVGRKTNRPISAIVREAIMQYLNHQVAPVKKEEPKPEEKKVETVKAVSNPWYDPNFYKNWDTEVLKKYLTMNLEEDMKKAIEEELKRRKALVVPLKEESE